MTFVFIPSPIFVISGAEQEYGEYPVAWHVKISELRDQHDELADWGDLALGSAWGAYSQDIYAVGWVDWILGRDEAFLAYIYVRIKNPSFKFGGTGLFDSEVSDLGNVRPWINEAPLPAWAASE